MKWYRREGNTFKRHTLMAWTINVHVYLCMSRYIRNLWKTRVIEREFESRTFQPFESALLSSQHLLLQLHSGYFEFLIHCDAGILQAGHFHEVAIARIAAEIRQLSLQWQYKVLKTLYTSNRITPHNAVDWSTLLDCFDESLKSIPAAECDAVSCLEAAKEW